MSLNIAEGCQSQRFTLAEARQSSRGFPDLVLGLILPSSFLGVSDRSGSLYLWSEYRSLYIGDPAPVLDSRSLRHGERQPFLLLASRIYEG